MAVHLYKHAEVWADGNDEADILRARNSAASWSYILNTI